VDSGEYTVRATNHLESAHSSACVRVRARYLSILWPSDAHNAFTSNSTFTTTHHLSPSWGIIIQCVSTFFKILFNIMFSFMLRGPNDLFPSRFPTKILYTFVSLLPRMSHAKHQACPTWYDCENNTWWRVRIVILVIVHFSPVFLLLTPCVAQISSSALSSETPSAQVLPLTLRLLMSYIYIYIYIYMEHLFLMFIYHTQRRSTVGRTPLDEWSARRRDLYLTTHDTHNRQITC
jgi:hypothetical protein